MQGGSAVLAQTLQAGSIASQGTLQYGSASAMQGGYAVLAQTLQSAGLGVTTGSLAAQAQIVSQTGAATLAIQGGAASTQAALLQVATSASTATAGIQIQTGTNTGQTSALAIQSTGASGQSKLQMTSSTGQSSVQVQGGQGVQMAVLGGSGSTASQVVYRLGTVQTQQSSAGYSSFYVSGVNSAPPATSTNPVYTIAAQNNGGFLWALGQGASQPTASPVAASSAAGSISVLGCYIMIASGFNYVSDMRLKKDVKQLTGHGLSSVAKLQGFLYEPSELAKEMHPDNPIDVKAGLSAQEVYKVAPEIVNTGGFPVDEETGETPEPSMSVEYSRLAPYFVEAFKELKTRVETLEAWKEAITGNSGTA